MMISKDQVGQGDPSIPASGPLAPNRQVLALTPHETLVRHDTSAHSRPSVVRQVGAKGACALLPRGPQFPHKSAAGGGPPQEAHRRNGTMRYLAARSL